MLESTNFFRNFQQFNLSVLFWSLSFIFVYKTSVSGAVALADALRQNSTLEHLAASVVDRNPRSRSFIVVNCTRDQCHFDFYLFKIHNLYICNMYIHDSLPCQTANCVKAWESNHGNWRLFISGSNDFGQHEATALASALRENRHLLVLDVRMNNIGNPGDTWLKTSAFLLGQGVRDSTNK